MSDKIDNGDSGLVDLNQQAKEAQKGIRKILAIWKTFARDSDRDIRILTLIATVIGFLALIAIIITCIHTGVFMFKPNIVDKPPYAIYMYILFGLGFLFLVVAVVVMLRFSNRAPANMLADGFESIYKQKYSTS